MTSLLAVLAAATGPLGALVGAAVVLLLLGAWARDSARQRARRHAWTVLSRASRASKLSDCPPEFLARLQAVMHLPEEGL